VLAATTAAVLAIGGAGYWGYQQYDAHRAEQLRVEARLADQLAAQKQATEQAQRAADESKREAQHAADEAKRETQLQAQKQAAEEGLRRAQEERNRLDADRKLLEAERRTAEATKRQAADEALRRLQEERTQLEQERKRLDADKKQADASQRTASAAVKDAPKLAALYDGAYNGRLCNLFTIPGDKAPVCWQVAVVVRNGIAEGSWWIHRTQKTARVSGTVANDGSIQLNLAAWASNGDPVEAILLGRIIDGAFTTSGKWSRGGEVVGDWKRSP